MPELHYKTERTAAGGDAVAADTSLVEPQAGRAQGWEAPRRTVKRPPAWGKLTTALLLMLALAGAWRYTPLSEYVTAQRMIDWARAVRSTPWAPLAVMLIYTPATFVMFPRPLLTLLTVIAFGPWLGFAYGMAGILIAAMVSYYAGRFMKQETVQRLAGDELMRVSKVLRRHGLLAVLAVRIVPAAPFVMEGIIAGAVRIRKWHFALGTFLGMLPGVLATTVFGDQIATALEDPSRISWWIVGAVVLAFAVLTWFLRRWFQKL